MELNLALIICTRNRPQMLNVLLGSIQLSETKPESIIVVSSGDDISKIIEVHRKSLRILHHHTNKIGQSNQKVIAIKMLEPQTKWVFFLDDDLELMPSTLTDACVRIKLIQNQRINGIGSRLVNKSSNSQDLNKDKNHFRKMIGKIRPSGRATKYAFNEVTHTEWLNGASIWRKDCLDQYSLPILNSKYAAYEDVIFSSEVSKGSKLLYDPRIKVIEQLSHSKVRLNLSQFKYICLWTGYLVCSRSDTKILNFKFFTMLRAIKFIAMGGFLRLIQQHKFKTFLRFFSQVILLPMDKSKSKKIIISLLELESNET